MGRHPRILGLATAVPPHVLHQGEARARVGPRFEAGHGPGNRLLEVFANAQVEERRTCMPLDWYLAEHGFAERNDRYVEHAVRLAGEATREALDRAGLAPGDVDHVVFVSSTGLATPSVDSLLANELGFRSDVRRTPLWGLGCAGGAAGLAQAADFARAAPDARVLLVSVELCTLTFQREDLSKKNLIAAALFGDGAAAVVLAGAEARVPARAATTRALSVLASGSTLWRDTRDLMGWRVGGDGLSVILSRDLPTFVRRHLRPSLEPFLARHGLTIDSIAHMVAHPGGVKVLEAWADVLDLPREAFGHARSVLRERGNMSSPTCLFVLERFLDAGDVAEGELALVSALGPGFSAEYVLLRGEAT